MSSVTVDGIVEITKGERYYPPDSEKKSLHVHYKSIIQTASGELSFSLLIKFWLLIIIEGVSLPVIIRRYTPSQQPILMDETVAYIRGSLHAPINDTAMIDCNQAFVTALGIPTDPGYQDRCFDMLCLYVYAIGQVTTHADLSDDGVSRSFNIAVNDYVMDDIKNCTLK